MGKKLEIIKENNAVLLFNKSKRCWEDRTIAISAIFEAYYYGKFTGYNIYFNGTNQYFFYTVKSVRVLNKVRNINIEKQDVYVDGEAVEAIKVYEFEKGYYRVYTQKTTIFTRNIILKSNKYRDIFRYYSKLAEYAGRIAEENSPLYFLSQNYKRITLSGDSVLFDYLQGRCNSTLSSKLLIVPFDFNQSQIEAIEKALKNKISVIEGPPGTGKTQTILNLITNILYCGKNCAVVSNNNTAIKNINEKLNEENLSFIAASLGSKKNVTSFFESDQNGELTNFLQQEEKPIKSSFIPGHMWISFFIIKYQRKNCLFLRLMVSDITNKIKSRLNGIR